MNLFPLSSEIPVLIFIEPRFKLNAKIFYSNQCDMNDINLIFGKICLI